jgi:hypothetical protein
LHAWRPEALVRGSEPQEPVRSTYSAGRYKGEDRFSINFAYGIYLNSFIPGAALGLYKECQPTDTVFPVVE